MNTQITSLADKAVLAKLSMAKWTPYKYDENTTAQVEAANGVKRVGRFNKHLMKECGALADVNAHYNAVYLYHTQNTLPWADDGVRMLPNELYIEYTQQMRQLIGEADRAADGLAAEWDALVQRDMARLGPLANISDYPPAYAIRAEFGADIKFRPIPQQGDFRIDILPEDLAGLEQEINEVENSVTSYILSELAEPLRKLGEKCQEYTGEKGQRWHHSLVLNVEEVVHRMARLNVNNDPKITKLADDIVQSIRPYTFSPDTLKENAVAREEARLKIDNIMGKMGAFMGGKS